MSLALLLLLALQAPPEKMAAVEGRVVDSVTGDPIPRAFVHVLGTLVSGKVLAHRLPADDSGTFRIELGPGTYRTVGELAGYVKPAIAGSILTISPGQTNANVTIKLVPQSIILGKITGEDDQPIGKANVQALRWRLDYRGLRILIPQAKAATNDQGEYQLSGLSPGDYILAVDPKRPQYAPTYFPGTTEPIGAQPVSVSSGATRQGLDLRLKKSATLRVKGKVLGSFPNTKNAPATVQLIPRDSIVHYEGVQRYAMVDGLQEFELKDVPAGAYLLTFHQQPTGQADRIKIDVGERDVTGLILEARPTPTLKGRIKAENVDFETILVTLEPRNPNPLGPSVGHATFLGNLAIHHVFPDTYRVKVSSLPAGYYVSQMSIAGAEIKGLLDLTAGVTGDLLILLEKGTAELSGRVVDKDQKALGDSAVVLFNERNEIVRSVQADDTGRYSIKELAPGKYRVAAAFIDIADADAVERLAARAEEITIAKSARESRQLEVRD